MISAELMEMGDVDVTPEGLRSGANFFVLDVTLGPDAGVSIEGSWEHDPADWLMPFIYVAVTLPNGERLEVDPKYNLQDDDREVGPFLAQQLLEHCYVTDWKWE